MFPTLVLKNQFGEQSNNSIIGGSAAVWANFEVLKTNPNGIANLQGESIGNVFMNTSATPSALNPNPIAGYIQVDFSGAFDGYQSVVPSFQAPLTGTPANISSGLTVGHVYVITAVGTSTAANWQAVGLPLGITPAVGVSFTATSASAGTGTGTVDTVHTGGAGIDHIEVVGVPNGKTAILVCYFEGTITAPTNGTYIGLNFVMLNTPAPLI